LPENDNFRPPLEGSRWSAGNIYNNNYDGSICNLSTKVVFDQVLFSKIQIVPKCGTCNAGNLQWESLFILKKGQTYPYFWNECPYPSDTDTLYTFMYLCPYH
jgi:hypothetical protein